MSVYHKIKILIVYILMVICYCAASKKSKKLRRGILRKKETNPINFIRLLAMRMIYGVATRLGFGENISEALNGAFIPPGVQDYDDYGFDLSDRDDYDDDY